MSLSGGYAGTPTSLRTLPERAVRPHEPLQGLVVKDRHHELGPLLAAVKRAYAAAVPAQREHIRHCVIETLVGECGQLGLDPELFRAHLGPQCRIAWAEVEQA